MRTTLVFAASGLAVIGAAALLVLFAGRNGPGPETDMPVDAQQEEPRVYISPDAIAEELRRGDVILFGGRAFWLQAGVNFADTSPAYGHVGIVVSLEDGIQVLQATGSPVDAGSVDAAPLETFLKQAEWLAIARPDWPEPFIAAALVASEGADGFDALFDLSTTDRLYCTELVDLALRTMPEPTRLETHRVLSRDVVLPEAILAHPGFRTVFEIAPAG